MSNNLLVYYTVFPFFMRDSVLFEMTKRVAVCTWYDWLYSFTLFNEFDLLCKLPYLCSLFHFILSLSRAIITWNKSSGKRQKEVSGNNWHLWHKAKCIFSAICFQSNNTISIFSISILIFIHLIYRLNSLFKLADTIVQGSGSAEDRHVMVTRMLYSWNEGIWWNGDVKSDTTAWCEVN